MQPHRVCVWFQGGPSLTDIIRYQEARRRDAGLQSGPTARRGLAAGRRRDDRIRTPPAVAGRKHYRGQTEPYLEEVRTGRDLMPQPYPHLPPPPHHYRGQTEPYLEEVRQNTNKSVDALIRPKFSLILSRMKMYRLQVVSGSRTHLRVWL